MRQCAPFRTIKLTPVESLIGPLAGSFFGALMVFLFGTFQFEAAERRRAEERAVVTQVENEKAAHRKIQQIIEKAHQFQMALAEKAERLARFKRDHLDPVRYADDRILSLGASPGFRIPSRNTNPDALKFLADTKYKSVIHDAISANIYFDESEAYITTRTHLMMDEVGPILRKFARDRGIEGQDFNAAKPLGPIMIHKLTQLTNHIYESVDRAIEHSGRLSIGIRDAMYALYPDEVVISFTMSDYGELKQDAE